MLSSPQIEVVIWAAFDFAASIVYPRSKSIASLEDSDQKEEAIAPTQSSSRLVISASTGVVEPVFFELTEP